jgi:hypothetical protein
VFWRPFNPKDIGRYLLAAERFERAGRRKGDRSGPLGADSDDAAMSFRDHAASYSGMIPPPLGCAFRPCDLDGFSGSGQA